MGRKATWLIGVVLLALLAPIPTLTAQAPPPDVRYIRIDADDYLCHLINATPAEAPHETETPFDPPPTFTPSLFFTPTPTAHDPTATQEAATTPPTNTPAPAVTPTTPPAPTTTPEAPCMGIVTSVTGLNVRKQPDLNAEIIDVLVYGAVVELFGITWDSAGNKWYDVREDTSGGNVFAAHIQENGAAACWGITED